MGPSGAYGFKLVDHLRVSFAGDWGELMLIRKGANWEGRPSFTCHVLPRNIQDSDPVARRVVGGVLQGAVTYKKMAAIHKANIPERIGVSHCIQLS